MNDLVVFHEIALQIQKSYKCSKRYNIDIRKIMFQLHITFEKVKGIIIYFYHLKFAMENGLDFQTYLIAKDAENQIRIQHLKILWNNLDIEPCENAQISFTNINLKLNILCRD